MVLDTLRGEWALRRNVDPTGEQLIGDADFASTGESALTYRESGILRLRDGRELSASRQYRYCAVGHQVDVQFADGPNTGKLFLNLEFSRKNGGTRQQTPTSAVTTPITLFTEFSTQDLSRQLSGSLVHERRTTCGAGTQRCHERRRTVYFFPWPDAPLLASLSRASNPKTIVVVITR